HAAGAFANDLIDLLARASRPHVDKGWRHRAPAAILAMTAGAVRRVERLVAPRHELEQPCHLVGVHVEETGLGIEGRPAPLTAAVDAGKDDDALVVRWIERILGSKFLEKLERRRMRGRRARRQVVAR